VAGLFYFGDLDLSGSAVRDWWSGGAGHLYFLVLVPQFYLLMLLWPTRRRPALWLTGAAVALQLLLGALRLYLPISGGAAHQVMLDHAFELFPFWIGYFAIGVAAGRLLAERRGRGLPAWPFAAAIPLAAAALLLADLRGAANPQFGDGTGAFLRPLLLPLVIAVCGAVVFGAPAVLRRLPRLAATSGLLSRHSLGVYILHPLLLTAIGRLLTSPLHTHLPFSILPWLAITSGAALGALLVTMLLARTPLAITLGEERPQRRTLLGQRWDSAQRRSTRATSAGVRRSGEGGGAASTRNA
jgi:surface polysaccharide O-acyltransferase-like enzyme